MYKSKKAAIELSIGTIVIIVLAMSMLILGLVLVKTIFTGAQYNVDTINEKVQGEINKLFEESGGRTYIYLPNSQANVKKGDSFGVAFSIKNDLQGVSDSTTFTYDTKCTSVQTGCPLTCDAADKYILLGGSGQFSLAAGQQLGQARIIKIQPSATAPLCEIQYDIEIRTKEDNGIYDTAFFIVKIQ